MLMICTFNHKFDEFLTNLNQLVDKHCPKGKLNKKSLNLRNKPWINNHIQRMMRIRDRTFQQFKQTESPEVYAHSKLSRNRVVNEIRNNEKTCFHNYFTENKSNMKLLWKGIRSVIKMRSNSGETNSIPFLTNDYGNKITDPSIIASNFNDYFINVASKITGKIPSSSLGAFCSQQVGCHRCPDLPLLCLPCCCGIAHASPLLDVTEPRCSWPASSSFSVEPAFLEKPLKSISSYRVSKIYTFPLLYCFFISLTI